MLFAFVFKVRKNYIIFMSKFLYILIALFLMQSAAHAQNVRISNMDSFDFGVWVSGNLIGDDQICVYKSSGNNRYRVTATDDSTITPNAFHLENPTRTIQIPYEVRWRNRPTTGGSALTYGVPSDRRRANQTSELCTAGGLSSNLRIRIRRQDLEIAPGGTYSAEVRIFIEPL